MARRVPPADLTRVKTYPLAERANKVRVDEFGRAVSASSNLPDFLEGLPDILAVKVLRELAAAIVQARSEGRTVAVAAGAHVVKVGVSPVIIGMMEEGTVTALAVTGAGAIHDWEIAAIGATSEDVGRVLHLGRFGMAEETGRALNEAAVEAARGGEGLGEVLGRRIVEARLPHRDKSLLGRAHELGVPVTVHVAIGSDIVHQHPAADGAAIGAATFTDFRRLVTIVSELAGGVWINLGSAVQLPEVFLKALSIAENLGHDPAGFATANMDMIRQYRTDENVLKRPTLGKGRSFALTGHHEINVPLLAAAVGLERARRETAR
jgi:deoxyhypusine synthase